jgi:PmbA protein
MFNTAGVDSYFEKSLFFAFTGAIAVDGDAQESAEGAEISAKFNGLDFEALGRDCGNRAAGLLRGKSIKSGNYDIILPPYVASDFLTLLSGLFLAGNIRKGKSLLAKNTKGDVIGSKILNIRDDALLDFGAGSYPVDGEGSAGQNKAVLEGGKLNTFLYDIINADKMNGKTTGNSARPDFKGLPDCGPSNFYIQAGTGTGCGETGILVNSLMGLHMTDTISGNFSLGINGWLVEKGEKKQAVKETLITGNIRDFLMKIDVICGDLKFYGNFGSPTIVARDISVAGK